jgi:hypothetical protein
MDEEQARPNDWADVYAAGGTSGGDDAVEGRRTNNIEQSVADGEGREILHPDGSLSRVADGTATSLDAGEASAPDDGSRGRVRLAVGSLWHEADPDSPAGQTFEIELPAGRITSRDATFGVMCEADGSAFVTAVAGEVTVIADQARPLQLAPLEAVMYSATGEFLDAIRAEPGELAGDPWIGRNLRLSDIDPAAVRLPSIRAPRPAPPAVADDAETTVTEPAASQAETAEAAVADTAVTEAPLADAFVAEAAAADLAEAGMAGSTAETMDAADTIDAEDATGTADATHTADVVGIDASDEVGDTAAATTSAWPTIDEPSTWGAGTAAVDDDLDEADAPELVVPTAVIARGEDVDDDEYEADEGAPPRRFRTAAAVFLILAGAAIVLVAVLSWIGRSSKSNVDASSTATTVTTQNGAAATTTTAVKPTTTAVPGTTAAPGTTAKPGTPTTTPGSATTTPPTTVDPSTRYAVHPTRCSQTGNQVTAEGTVTNADTVAHSYKIEVVFTTDNGATTATTATATVQHVPPNVPTSWSTTTTYAPDLAKGGGGCRIGNVTILD